MRRRRLSIFPFRPEAADYVAATRALDDAKRAAMAQVREIEQRAREDGEERARKIVTIAIQRVASEQTALASRCSNYGFEMGVCRTWWKRVSYAQRDARAAQGAA